MKRFRPAIRGAHCGMQNSIKKFCCLHNGTLFAATRTELTSVISCKILHYIPNDQCATKIWGSNKNKTRCMCSKNKKDIRRGGICPQIYSVVKRTEDLGVLCILAFLFFSRLHHKSTLLEIKIKKIKNEKVYDRNNHWVLSYLLLLHRA